MRTRLAPMRFLLVAIVAAAPLRAQSTSSRAVRVAAAKDTTLRILVSVNARRLFVLTGAKDTLLTAPVAVGSKRKLTYHNEHWDFSTKPAIRRVVSKETDPMWIPPDWHYVEVARRSGLRLVWLSGDTTIAFRNGKTLIVTHDGARIETDSTYEELGPDMHIIVGRTLYVPPIGFSNRSVPAQLGKFRLVLGDGVGLHGTPETASIGHAVTHGCIRLFDDDIAWLYDNIPVGTRVYIY